MSDRSIAVDARDLSKRYRNVWALNECSFQLPANQIVALVGANGAGKSTLLSIIAGLLPATSGALLVNGRPVLKGRAEDGGGVGGRVAILAQDKPLYRDFSAADMLRFGRCTNRVWDQRRALSWLERFDVPLRRRCGKLSGGQQAQVALTIALARRPEFLVLDEPLAPLDPLARHEFLAAVMETAAEDGTSVLFSSHVITELERVADYLVVLACGRVQVAGDVEDLVASHQVLTGPAAGTGAVGAQFDVVHAQKGLAQAHLLVRRRTAAARPPEGWQAHPVTLEELMLAYLREPEASALPGPEPLAASAATGVTS